jgi:hypothetical protein
VAGWIDAEYALKSTSGDEDMSSGIYRNAPRGIPHAIGNAGHRSIGRQAANPRRSGFSEVKVTLCVQSQSVR